MKISLFVHAQLFSLPLSSLKYKGKKCKLLRKKKKIQLCPINTKLVRDLQGLSESIVFSLPQLFFLSLP